MRIRANGEASASPTGQAHGDVLISENKEESPKEGEVPGARRGLAYHLGQVDASATRPESKARILQDQAVINTGRAGIHAKGS